MNLTDNLIHFIPMGLHRLDEFELVSCSNQVDFLSFWNEYILAMTIMTDPKMRTLPVGLTNLQQASRGAAEYGRLYAGLVLVMLPTLILYILVQKQLTEGMMVGGDKG